ncbi:MAG: D-amino acid aminotransferase [Methylococcales bacterium]
MAETEIQIVYLNGDYCPLHEAKISVLDRGFLFGDGIYEVIPVYQRHIFHFERHMARLEKNLAAIRLTVPFNRQQLREIIEKLLTGEDQESVYLQITRGIAKRDHQFPADTKPTLFVMSTPVKQQPKHGIACITLEDDRWQHCDIKSIALLPNVLLRQQAHDQHSDEAILIRDGYVTEGAASNVFIVLDNQIITAPQGPFILPGVTRDVVLELAQNAGLNIAQSQFRKQQLIDASEIWITSSTKDIVPVISLNQQPVSQGKPGAIWQQMNALFQSHKQQLIQQVND